MSRKTIETPDAPAVIGPYSQAIVEGGFVFCSGQIAIDPVSGDLVGAGDVQIQATQVLRNLRAVLEAAGSSMDQVCKTTIFLVDLQDFAAVNQIYQNYFPPDSPPARSTVQAAALPKGALVEIDAIARC